MMFAFSVLLSAPSAHAATTDQPKKVARVEREADAEAGTRKGASARHPEGAKPAKDNPVRERHADPVADNYHTDGVSWFREDFGKPWRDYEDRPLDKDRIREFKSTVDALMDKRSALASSTKVKHRPKRRTLRVPENLDLSPPLLAWIGPNLELQPASGGLQQLQPSEAWLVWSMSAAAVDFRGETPRAAAFTDRRIINERSTVTVNGKTYVEFDASGHPVRAARVSTDSGDDGCEQWKTTELWSLKWSAAGTLSQVDETRHYACGHLASEVGWASFATSTTVVGR